MESKKMKAETENIRFFENDAVDQLIRAMEGYGFEQKKLKLAEFRPARDESLPQKDVWLRGIATTQKVEHSECFIAIPFQCLITTWHITQDPAFQTLLKKQKEPDLAPVLTSATQILILFLLFHLKGRSHPLYKSYLDLLPESFDTCLYYSHEHIEQLQYPPHKRFVHIQQKKLNENYQIFITFLNRLPSHFADLFDLTPADIDFDLYRRFFSSIMTRSIYIEPASVFPNSSYTFTDDQSHFNESSSLSNLKFNIAIFTSYILLSEKKYALVPYLDFINHANVDVSYNYNKQTHCFEVTALCEFAPLSQVFIPYSKHPNSLLLLEYGFILNSNPENFLEFDLPFLRSDFSASKLLYIDRFLPFLFDKRPFIAQDDVSWNFLTLLRIFYATDTQISDSLLDETSCPKQIESQVWSHIAKVANRYLGDYGTTLEADKESLKHHNFAYRDFIIIRNRITEKEMWNSVIRLAHNKLQKM